MVQKLNRLQEITQGRALRPVQDFSLKLSVLSQQTATAAAGVVAGSQLPTRAERKVTKKKADAPSLDLGAGPQPQTSTDANGAPQQSLFDLLMDLRKVCLS